MKLIKNVLSIFVVATFIIGLAFPTLSVNANNINTETPNLTVDSYTDWLLSQRFSRNLEVREVDAFLNEFNNLSQVEQEKFVSYLNNEELFSYIIDAFISDKDLILEDGNIVIETVEDYKYEIDARSSIQRRRATFRRVATFAGVSVMETEIGVVYSHNGSRITANHYGTTTVIRNFVPFSSFTWSHHSRSGVGTTTAVHSARVTHRSPGGTRVAEKGVRGTVQNTTTGWIRNV